MRPVATSVYECHLRLYTRVLTGITDSGHATLPHGAVTVAALVVLAGCLPGHAELGGNLRPSDAQVYGLV